MAAVLRDGDALDRSRGGGGGKPDYGVLPVVTVAEAAGGGVLGHVPCIHDGVVGAVLGGAGVDLAWAGGAAGTRTASGV